MKTTKIFGAVFGAAVLCLAATGCASTSSVKDSGAKTALPLISMNKWLYNSTDDVYYQTGISYCENPVDTKYETLGIFVPGSYFDGVDNGDGTFTVTVNKKNRVNGYTSFDAPIVLPVNTPGYSAMRAPTGYQSAAVPYTKAGFIYFNPGCRGRNEGAPAGITDLKAAIRYLRYNQSILPGNTGKIFSFGMSGGGAQSALLGATGDSALYEPYLADIGAVMGVSDAVCGSMDWCPITNLDSADEAYEWNMGATRTGLSELEQSLSDGLTDAFAAYINGLGLKDDKGNVLKLEQSEDGRWQAGTYYDWIISEVERSLNNFLADTKFPYDSSKADDGGFGDPSNLPPEIRAEILGGNAPMGPGAGPAGGPGAGPAGNGGMEGMDFTKMDNIKRGGNDNGVKLDGVYETVQDYIDALNANGTWVTYDASTNTAKITSLADFAKAVKNASKSVGAFDDLNGTQGENSLFGYGDGNGAHFDSTMAKLLADTEYGSAYASDVARRDALGTDVQTRINMYTPLYYLLPSYNGYKTSKVAKFWRIRTGIFQGDTSVTTESNLAQALKNYGIRKVDFEMVWGMKHTMAERTGSSTQNFIQWVEECTAVPEK